MRLADLEKRRLPGGADEDVTCQPSRFDALESNTSGSPESDIRFRNGRMVTSSLAESELASELAHESYFWGLDELQALTGHHFLE